MHGFSGRQKRGILGEGRGIARFAKEPGPADASQRFKRAERGEVVGNPVDEQMLAKQAAASGKTTLGDAFSEAVREQLKASGYDLEK